MDAHRRLSHTVWDCKYHIVLIPKCRRKKLYAGLRQHLGKVFRQLAVQKDSEILEGHLIGDHVHMIIAISPKHAVAQVVGYISRSLVISKVRAQSIWRASMASGSAISLASISGPEGTMSTRLGAMKRRSATTSATRRRRMPGLTSWVCGDEPAAHQRRLNRGREANRSAALSAA